MKNLTVENLIFDNVKERGQKAFETRLKKELNKYGIKGNFEPRNAGMIRASGYGSYYLFIDFDHNRNNYTIKEHTHNSVAWDNWNEPTTKQKRQLFEAVFFDNIERIIEEINEEELNEEEY